MKMRLNIWRKTLVAALMTLLVGGCATETIETRKHDKWLAYAALPPHQREAVDAGQIRLGMSQEAVHIAWGKPVVKLASQVAEGYVTTWRYQGKWTYREIRREGQPVLEQSAEQDRKARNLMRAEIVFTKGKVTGWRILVQPQN